MENKEKQADEKNAVEVLKKKYGKVYQDRKSVV